jgi:coatomer subunit beta
VTGQRSSFSFISSAGEDALANLSIEKQEGILTGHIRIRSKTQGIALSLGDKVSLAQKAVQPTNEA